MNLQETLTQDNIYQVSATTGEEVIFELLTHLAEKQLIKSHDDAFADIIQRENNQCSSAGRGLAYPHGEVDGLKSFIAIMGISKKGIHYNSPDRQPCHIFMLTISPSKNPKKHKRFLNLYRSMIQDSNIRENIIESKTSQEIVSIIHFWENNQMDMDI